MTFVLPHQKPVSFLNDFCGKYLRRVFVDILDYDGQKRVNNTPDPALISDLKTKVKDETCLLLAFIADWYAVKYGEPPYFFQSGKWFWYPERKLALPLEALTAMTFAGKNSLDFPYVHSDWNNLNNRFTIRHPDLPHKVQTRLRTEFTLGEGVVDMDKAAWLVAAAQYPVHMFNQDPDNLYHIDLGLSYRFFKKLSKESRSLDGKVKT